MTAISAEPAVRHARRHPVDMGQFKLRRAEEADYEELVMGSTVIYDDDAEKITVVYLELEEEFPGVVDALQRVRYGSAPRSNGMVTTSKVFGFQPRITMRRDFCTAAGLAHEDPGAHRLFTGLAGRVATYYQHWHPELYADHQKQVEKVLPNWRLEDSVFTSGIINKNNPLLYHHDAGNFRNVWSNMLAFRNKVSGGYLAVPEYNLGFQIRDRSLLMFDGQNLLHGVTPIHLQAPDSYRFTMVFYSLRGMWTCLPPGEELQRYRKVRTERERKRAELPIPTTPTTQADVFAKRKATEQ